MMMDRRPTILDARVLAGSGGGPDKTIIQSPPFLEQAGYRMLCVYLHHPADPGFEVLRRRAAERGVHLISVADEGPLDWRVVPRLIDLCRRERVQVWHGHDYKTNLLGLVLRRVLPLRLVTTVHGWVHRTRRTPLYYFLDRAALRWYEWVLCVSDDLVRSCRRAGVPPSRCILLENGIDTDRFRRRLSPPEARLILGLPSVPTVGALGRLSAEKGFDILIRAVDRLLASGLDIGLVIAGAGPEEERLRTLIADLGRSNRIRLLGFRDDLAAVYECLDVYALSSYREGLPNVLLEALAMETPIVATRIAGVPRLLDGGRLGELIEPGSVEALAVALQRLLADPGRRAELARSGRAWVEERYSFRERMARLIRLYDAMGLQGDRRCDVS